MWYNIAMEMNINILIFLIPFLFINIVAMVYMMLDKNRSIRKFRRVPEGNLFFISICFGALGILAGMYLFRHKTRKWYFMIGVPLALAENIALIIVLAQSFELI